MKKKINYYLMLTIMLFFTFTLFSAEFSREDAKRIDRFLKKAKKTNSKNMFLRKVTFTEKNLILM